jgi:high affinity Mn2+ porin
VRLAVALALLAAPRVAAADPDDGQYLAPHPDARWWLSAQANVITQAQPGFHSPYTGPNSFLPGDHDETSFVATLYGGFELTSTTTIILTGESAGGAGLSAALGVAGFTNLDVVRNPTLGPTPYVGRAFIDQIIPLDDTWVTNDRNPLRIQRRLPAHRLEIRVGKMGTVDYFDTNSIGTDSHLQFLNWSTDNNGAYDYAADTRGYTLGAVIEYAAPTWALRFGEMLMPTIANGIDYDYSIAHARGEQLELELHGCVLGKPGVLRLLGFWNHARMGNYDEANAVLRTGLLDPADAQHEIEETRAVGRTKVGFGINVEQEVSADVHLFGRLGWNDGNNESFAYTEIDNTLELGGDLHGTWWHRPHDKLGLAVVTNGLSTPHRTYLALGGDGFLLGDGQLPHYGREDIAELYYTARVYRGISPSLDIQVIDHPGFNVDRGPVVVGSLRLHVEI